MYNLEIYSMQFPNGSIRFVKKITLNEMEKPAGSGYRWIVACEKEENALLYCVKKHSVNGRYLLLMCLESKGKENYYYAYINVEN